MKIDNSDEIRLRKTIKNINEKYKGNDFVYTENLTADSLNAWERFKQWLAEIFKDFFNSSSAESSMKAVVYFLRAVGILLILFVLYKIAMLLLNEDGHFIFGRKSKKLNLNVNDLENNIHQTDFNELINNAVAKNDYRLAIRYYYLSVLKRLSEKEKITWDAEKTNYDYYQEIKNTVLKKQFQYISYIYDYSWYGEFDMDENEFNTSKLAFEKTLEMANNKALKLR